MTTAFRLCIEPVPEPIWGENLRSRSALGKYRWRKLRATILEQLGPACAICGRTENPHGHEVWEYTEKRRLSIAKLLRIEIICGKCHAVQHWGLTSNLFLHGSITPDSFRDLIRHACKVNKCKPKEFKAHVGASNIISERRSKLRWRIDWDEFKELVSDAKAARVEWAIMMENVARRRVAESEDDARTHAQRRFDGDGPPVRRRRGRLTSRSNPL